MSNKFFFLTLLLGSFLISSLFWFGAIDQDYYSFYYVGQGVSEGHKMYTDFADNKGPILYLVFAFLNILFGKNLDFALIAGSTVIDALILFIVFKVIQRDWGFKWFKNKALNLLFIVFCLLLFKSFSMGTLIGGLYSENVGMLFLALSLWTLTKKNSALSGVLFSLSYLSRITYVLFLPFLFLELYLKYRSLKLVFKFIAGQLIICAAFFIYFLINGELSYFFYNVIELNLNYVGTSRGIQFYSIFATLSSHPTIFFTLVLSITLAIFKIIFKQNSKEFLRYTSLVICSGLASFAGGIFYFHHFLQFGFVTILTLCLLTQKGLFKARVAVAPIIIMLACLLFFNFLLFVNNSKYFVAKTTNRHSDIRKIPTKKNIIIVPYYPIYYFVLDKKAPDRYFQSFFLMKNFNGNNSIDIKRHKTLDEEKINNTSFLFVHRNEYDKMIVDEYKGNFEKEFNLKKVNTYHDLDATIEIYESSGK